MSRDPLGYADGVNLYAYVGNNPTTFVDPWGTEKVLLGSTSIDFVLENTYRLDLNDVASWKRVNAHVNVICMLPENYNHYHCIDTVRGAVKIVGFSDEELIRLNQIVEKIGVVTLLRKGVKHAIKEVAGDESCAAFARLFSSTESMIIGGSLCMVGVGSMNQKELDNIMRMAGKADDIATLAQKLKNVKFSQKAMKNMNDSNRYVPTEYLKDTILNGKKALDPQGSSATMHYGTIYRNGKKYNLEVLYNESTNEIWHFKYW